MKKYIIVLMTITVTAIWCFPVTAYEIEGVNIHGFLSQGWIKTSGNNVIKDSRDGSFQLDEIGINFSKELTDKLRVGIQLFAKDYGEVGNNEIEIDWAYGDYHFKDWLGFRVGKVKAPHGLYNETRDVDMVRTFIFLPQSIYPEVIRDVALAVTGAGVYGSLDLNKAGSLSYQFAYGTHEIDSSERKIQSFLDLSAGNVDVTENDFIAVDYKYSGSLVWDTPLDGLRLSGTIGDMPFTSQSHAKADFPPIFSLGDIAEHTFKKFEQKVYSAEYTWNDLVLAAEYMETEKDFQVVIPLDTVPSLIESEGYYVSLSYRFTDWFAFGTYYAKCESTNKSDLDEPPPDEAGIMNNPGRLYEKDMTFTARFDINEYMTFKTEWHKLKGTNLLFPFDNPEDANGNRWTDKWDMFIAKVTFSF